MTCGPSCLETESNGSKLEASVDDIHRVAYLLAGEVKRIGDEPGKVSKSHISVIGYELMCLFCMGKEGIDREKIYQQRGHFYQVLRARGFSYRNLETIDMFEDQIAREKADSEKKSPAEV
jgi:hypothetical protein